MPRPQPTKPRKKSADDAALVKATDRGNNHKVGRLLSGGANPNAVGPQGFPALVRAAAKGHVAVLDQLLRAGANTEARDKRGNTAIIFATSKGQSDCVRRLLEAGACVDAASSDGNSALLVAAVTQDLKCLRLLLRAGADRTQRNGKGVGVLDYLDNDALDSMIVMTDVLSSAGPLTSLGSLGKTVLPGQECDEMWHGTSTKAGVAIVKSQRFKHGSHPNTAFWAV